MCGFLPTLATDSVGNLKKQISEIKKAMSLQNSTNTPMAKILGVHLEACFLNSAKKGIHNEQQLLKPTIENYQLIEDEIIKIVTLAPELDEDFLLCNYLKERDVRVSAGHCLGADLSHVTQVTHLFNAMGEFSHRKPSTVVSALVNDDIFVELIADLKHVQKDVVKTTFNAKPLNRIILISDALPITHSDKVSMEFCSKNIFLKEGNAVDANGTIAGSTAFVSDIIKKLVKEGIIDLVTAVSMASENIAYLSKMNANVYWNSNFDICAMQLNNDLITFNTY